MTVWARVILAATSATPPALDAGAGPQGSIGWGTWPQILQALASLLNLSLVIWFFRQNRNDRRKENERGVDSFWLQKVIMEPNVKEIDELHKKLSDALKKVRSQAEGSKSQGHPMRELDELASSASDQVARTSEALRFKLVPLLRAVMDSPAAKPSDAIDAQIDKINDAVTEAISEICAGKLEAMLTGHRQLDEGRNELFRLLVCLHRDPFKR